ncbi:ESPR-type extended signal peptide-containing protein [Taylorella equigenitalis]|uniref:ESPR-type extended signal peptide-containing protein n=1 Tax=Taylorella equigenitalis TaxID=29575 RepID=UPI00237D124B|nr:YadA-like family protein [Taylorella equigenitalis]WDU53673.1 YadA-like family protein [Taylorella equigenitalis]
MNTIFKTIYNEVLGAWVAVSEITKTGGKKSKNKMLSTAIIVTIAGGASVSFAQTTVPDNKNNVVDGGKSVAVGEENKVYGGASLGFGTQNLIGFTDAKAGNALVAGFRNISTANYSTAIGSNNMSTSVDSLAFGKGNFTGDFTKFSAIRTKAGTGANQPGNGGTWNALETKLNETVAKYNLTAISAANLKEMQAIGVQNLAINLGALAFGNRNISAGQRSIAIGNESVALKNNSTALGYKNLVNGIVANAFGAQNTVEAHNGLAVGVGNKVTGLYGISIGNASVTGADLTTLQNISTVSGVHSISLGNSNAVKGQYALVVGKSSRAYLDNSIAIGSKSISKGLNSTAIGSTAQAMNASSLAVGHNAISLGDKSVSIGNAQSLEKSTTAIGSNAKAWVFHSTAIGNTSEARGESSLAVGQNNKSYVAHSFSAGDWNSIKGRYAGSFGYHNNINNHGSYSYGNENTIDSNLSMAIGSSNNINSSADRTFILGRGINATHQNSVILGNKSESKAATAISSAKISGLSVTSFAGVGNAEYGVVSVGSNIKKEYFKDDLFTKNGNDPALKKRNSPEYIEYLAKIAFKKQELIKARLTDNPDADISDITDDYAIAKIKEGDANFKEPEWTPKLNQDQLNAAHKLGPRQIVNVAAGAVNENSTDAINGSQLFQVAKAIIDNGIKVQGDAGNAKTVKIGETVRIEGNASWADTDQGNNIATNTTGTGIMIGLKKALTGMTSGDFGGTVINADGVKVADNIKLADAGLTVGSVVIQPNKATVSGLQNPTANDEAVNLGYLTTKLTDLTNGGIKFTGNDGGDHTLKLGQKITIKGTANYADTDGGANIATQASDGQLLIGLKKALTGLTSVAIENGPTLSNAGIDAGGKPISNLKPATDTSGPNDAANVQYVKDKVEALKNAGYTLTGDSGTTGVKPIGSSIAFTGDANISTAASGTGVAIALKPNLTGLTSGTFGDTVINGDGVKVADNIKLADAGLIVGSVVIQPNKATVSGLQNPTANDEAVNLGYLTTKLTDLTDGGIKFTGNDGGDHTLKLGQKITIKGTANYADTDGGANIATQASDGQLLIGLKKALTGLTSVAIENGPTLSNAGIDAGGKKISNLKPADENSADNDAANVKFVKDKVDALKNEGYTLTGDSGTTGVKPIGSSIAFTGDANISTAASGTGVAIALKPNLTGLTSGTFGDTVINGDGVKVADNIKLADDGLTAGNVRIDPTSNKITGLEAPTDDKDAVNKKFLDDAVKGLTDGGIKFTGNDGGDHTLALGQKITIKGLANYADTDGGANIATQASDGQLLIGLKKALTGLTSVAIENGPTLSNAGIDAGGMPISNLKPATDTSGPNDAANVQYVKDKVDALKNEGYTLTGDSGTTGVKPIGSSIAFTGDENLTTTASNTGVAIALNKSLQNMQSVAISNGPILNADGLKINDKVKLGSDGLTAGNVRIDPASNKISGIEAPTDDKDAANKKYVDDHITNLNNNPLTFETNDGSTPKKLGDTLKIKGSDSNATKDNFDLSNIMTWIDENGVLRIGIRKSLELSSIKASDGAGKSATLNPDSLVFAGVDGKNGADGTVTMKVTTTGPADVKGNTLNRLSLNDVSIATLNDGFKYAGNVGGPISVTLNQTINIQGATANTNAKLFDGGKNVMTEVAQDGDGVKYTVAIKKSPEFENVTLTGTPAEGSTVAKPGKLAIQDGANKDKIIATVDGKGNSDIALKGASDKDIVKIGADSDSNGKVSVIGKDGANSTDLKHDGLAINDVSGTSNLGTNAQGTGGVEDLVANASAKKRRLTHTVDGKTEEIATLNDGLIVKGNTTDKAGVKLNNAVKVAGADSNTKWEDFDGGENIMTKVETVNGETVIRVAMKKDLKLKDGNFGGDGKDGSVTVSNGDGTETVSINPDKINFTGVPGKDGQPAVNVGIQMSQDGPNHVDGTKPATRLQVVNGDQVDHVATMNDGLKFSANTGEDSANKLNTTVNIKGDTANTNWSEFDLGKNIMTKIEANKKGETDITVALKRDIVVDTAVVGTAPVEAKDGQPAIAGKDGNITVVNKNGKTAIVINSAGDTGPEIAVNKSDSAEGTKLTTNGLEISKNGPDATKPTKAVVSIAPNGVPSVSEDASSSKPRLTLASGGKTESIATMNDGLKFQGDVESVDKLLSNTLTMVGGETDEKKLTTVEADKNIGVIVKDVADAGSRAPADKVMQVRLAKKLKGLESAEFKPVDAGGNATGQSIMIGAGGVTVTKGGNTASFSEDGLRVGENGPSMTSNGINAGGMPVTNVGTPIKANDAATKGYVDAELAKQQNQLGNNIEEVRKDALGASAMAIATAGLPQAYIPGKSAFAVAGGAVKGHSAFAMGISTISDSGKWILKGTVSGDGRTQVGGSIGAAYQW